MKAPAWDYRSSVPGAGWPAVPGGESAPLLALQFQLERSQWLAPAQLQALQFRQLHALLQHAYESVPYYGQRWRGLFDPTQSITPEAFSRLPILSRSELQGQFEPLRSARIPASHGAVAESRTSGSTGMPVRVLKTGLVQLLWQAVVLREHHWFQRDLGGKLAAIRQGVEESESDGWGSATDAVARTGPSATLSVRADVGSQLKWLERHQPDYLLTYPSNLAELIRSSIANGVRLNRLREVRTFGEILPAETRALCCENWGVPVSDAYSAQETGYIALQCPLHQHYHVQSESVLHEVLADDGSPCGVGETGRLVITPLHNFAMPLVRYEIGDFAEVGAPCSCGRGLPVLRRVVGRVRNMLVTATGERYWPAFGSRTFAEIAPIMQYQLAQKAFDLVEARLVTGKPLTADQESRLRQLILSRIPPGFRVTLVYCERIARGAGGKFEDFVSELEK
jgi:phenylacetate-CoA ligase